jgi:hypothetical protein
MINISKKAQQVARANDFYIEYGVYTPEDGSEDNTPTIDISEENSDLFIMYVQNSTGNFDLLMCPDYVQDIPQRITSTRQLTKTMEYIVNNYIDC